MSARTEPSFVSASPAPGLRPYVDGYVGYRWHGLPGGVHRGLPSRNLTVIVSIGSGIEVLAQPDPAQPAGTYGFVLSGLAERPALVAARGPEEGVVIELTPLGSRAVLGVPAGALSHTTVEAAEVIGPAATELRDRLHQAPAWAERFGACDDVLGRLLHRRRHEPAAPLRWAWGLLVGSGGSIAVADVAEQVGWSRRHLAQRFQGEFGLSPKAAARVVRFERACTLLRRRARLPLAEVAVACGYYDQPHLTREFVRLAGCPPARWLAAEVPAEFPIVQDTHEPAVRPSAP